MRIADSRNFVQQNLSVSVSGDYTFDDLYQNNDGRIVILAGPYDPANVTNCVTELDDMSTVTLDAGVEYTLLLAGYGGQVGTFTYRADGPGVVTTSVKNTSMVEAFISPASVPVGTSVDLTAEVTSTSPGAGLAGAVEFFADGNSLGTSPVTSGIAVLSGVQLPEGTHLIAAMYSGNGVTLGSTTATPVTLTVTPTTVTPPPITPAPLAPSTSQGEHQRCLATRKAPPEPTRIE